MKELPPRPNLDYLYREAKAIKSRHRRADESVCPTIGHFDTSLHKSSAKQIFSHPFSILDAQRVVARQYSFSSWRRLKCFVESARAGENPRDPTLAKRVIDHNRLMMAAQKDTQELGGDRKNSYDKYRKLTLKSTDILRPAYELYGWPGPEVIGKEGFDALIYLAGNAVYDSEFQKQTLAVMSDALSEGKVYGYWHAAFKDRYLSLSNQPTVYGISFVGYMDDQGVYQLLESDVIDPDNLDKRRAQVGHTSYAVEMETIARQAIEENWSVGTFDQEVASKNRLAMEGGYIQ